MQEQENREEGWSTGLIRPGSLGGGHRCSLPAFLRAALGFEKYLGRVGSVSGWGWGACVAPFGFWRSALLGSSGSWGVVGAGSG